MNFPIQPESIEGRRHKWHREYQSVGAAESSAYRRDEAAAEDDDDYKSLIRRHLFDPDVLTIGKEHVNNGDDFISRGKKDHQGAFTVCQDQWWSPQFVVWISCYTYTRFSKFILNREYGEGMKGEVYRCKE